MAARILFDFGLLRCGYFATLRREHRYLKNKNDLSPEFIAFDLDDSVLLVPVPSKLKQLSAGAFFGSDLAALKAAANGPLAETIRKMIR
jgi:hypothetical protein